MKIIFIGLLSCSIIFNSCSTTDAPPAIPATFLSDVNGGFGAVQMAMAIFGPPTNPAQGICYAVYGSVSAVIASGYSANRDLGWPAHPVSLDAANAKAASFYDSSTMPFALIGKVHNDGLNSFAMAGDGRAFDDQASMAIYLDAFMDTSAFFALKTSSCTYNRRNALPADSLVQFAMSSIDSYTTLHQLEDKYNELLRKFPEAGKAIGLVRGIAERVWVYHASNNKAGLEAYLKAAAKKVNENDYQLDMVNYTYAITAMNIMVYSYSYWSQI
jgi:hypothetical protein